MDELTHFLVTATSLGDSLAVSIENIQERLTTLQALLIDYNLCLSDAIDFYTSTHITVVDESKTEHIKVRVV